MYESAISVRNKIIHFLYTKILKRIFFLIDPEVIHDRMVKVGKTLGANPTINKFTAFAFSYKNTMLEQEILGIHFPNPVGLAAGFDKNAQLTQILPAVGFGYVEVGSITGEPCKGNEGKRLWRLPKSKSLVVYYGLMNDGAEKLSAKLRDHKFDIPVGISVAKTNCKETVDLQKGIDDYVKAHKLTAAIGSYTTVNISCPNAYGGEPFTAPDRLEKLLQAIDQVQTSKPVFVKLSPDLSKEELDAIIEVCDNHHIKGLICTNLTKNRSNPLIKDDSIPEKGGLSGKVQEELSNKQIQYLYQKTNGRYIIIGCGGVFTAEDAYKKIKAGASLIQLITGMIFEGPQVVSQINQGLTKLLNQDGYQNISEAIGKDN